MTNHKHIYDSAIMYIEGSQITPAILACACGSYAVIGEGVTVPMWEPEEEDEN